MRISWSISATTYSYLKCIVYDKLLKPRQSFWITLYSYHGKNKYSREHPHIRGLTLGWKMLICSITTFRSHKKVTVECEVSDSTLQKYSSLFYAYNMARLESGLTSKSGQCIPPETRARHLQNTRQMPYRLSQRAHCTFQRNRWCLNTVQLRPVSGFKPQNLRIN